MKLKNLDKVEAWSGGRMLDPGYHTVRIESAVEGQSSKGNPQIELEFRSPNGSIRDWLVVVESTYGKVAQLLDAAGIKRPSGEIDFDVSDLVGKSLLIFVGEEPDYNDPQKTRKRVQSYEPVGSQNTPAPDTAGLGNGQPQTDDDIPF